MNISRALSVWWRNGTARCWCRTGDTSAEGSHRPSYGGNYGDATQDWHGYIVSGAQCSSSVVLWRLSSHMQLCSTVSCWSVYQHGLCTYCIICYETAFTLHASKLQRRLLFWRCPFMCVYLCTQLKSFWSEIDQTCLLIFRSFLWHQISWVSDWVSEWLSMPFSPWASSAVEAVKGTKFGTQVASRIRMMPECRIHA